MMGNTRTVNYGRYELDDSNEIDWLGLTSTACC